MTELKAPTTIVKILLLAWIVVILYVATRGPGVCTAATSKNAVVEFVHQILRLIIICPTV